MRRILWIGLIIILLGIVGWLLYSKEGEVKKMVGGGSGFVFDQKTPGYENFLALDNGCPFKDCIEAIKNPKFESAAQADNWLGDDEVVLGIDYQGVQRAYPQRIMNWHEIVNQEDWVITFCPLTGSGIGFLSKDEFGVSGKLTNSNLVMYDKKSGSLWQQITGEAIVGDRFREKLEMIQVHMLKWRDWKRLYPESEVMSRNTGFVRDYEKYPYDNYEEIEDLYFPVNPSADSGKGYELHPKTVIYGVEINGEAKAYTWEVLREETREDGVMMDTVGRVRIRLSLSEGEVLAENMSKKSSEIVRRMFWFGWKAFYPETEVMK